jgi:hypothetical protein
MHPTGYLAGVTGDATGEANASRATPAAADGAAADGAAADGAAADAAAAGGAAAGAARAAGAAAAGVDAGGGAPKAAVFRLPSTAYLVVLFLAFGTVPLAFSGAGFGRGADGGIVAPPAAVGWQTLLLLVPLGAAIFVARTATLVDGTGIRVRAVLGSSRYRWAEVRGLKVEGRDVYAVLADGAVRLPFVHVNSLGALARASGGHLPPIPDAKVKAPPTRRRRR